MDVLSFFLSGLEIIRTDAVLTKPREMIPDTRLPRLIAEKSREDPVLDTSADPRNITLVVSH